MLLCVICLLLGLSSISTIQGINCTHFCTHLGSCAYTSFEIFSAHGDSCRLPSRWRRLSSSLAGTHGISQGIDYRIYTYSIISTARKNVDSHAQLAYHYRRVGALYATVSSRRPRPTLCVCLSALEHALVFIHPTSVYLRSEREHLKRSFHGTDVSSCRCKGFYGFFPDSRCTLGGTLFVHRESAPPSGFFPQSYT